MTTQNELNQAKASLKNTLQTKRLTTLQNYNHFRFKKEKISFESFKKTFIRLDEMMKIIFMDTVVSSDLSVSEKMRLVGEFDSKTILSNNILSYIKRLLRSKSKFDIYWAIDSCNYIGSYSRDSIMYSFKDMAFYSISDLIKMKSIRLRTLFSLLLSL